MFIVSHATVCFCMFLVDYPQTPEPVIPLVDWHKLTYLVLTCRKTPINQRAAAAKSRQKLPITAAIPLELTPFPRNYRHLCPHPHYPITPLSPRQFSKSCPHYRGKIAVIPLSPLPCSSLIVYQWLILWLITLIKFASLEVRRLHTDLTWCYTILFGRVQLKSIDFFQLSPTVTRGYIYKLYTSLTLLVLGSHLFFSERVVNAWNFLPAKTVDFNSLIGHASEFYSRLILWHNNLVPGTL